MIATVTVNPCIDKTVEVEKFELTKTNRVDVKQAKCAGKGINVAATLHALGAPVVATGFDFHEGASRLKAELSAAGIESDFCDAKGELRVCTKVFDRTEKNTVEFNERGTPVGERERLLFLEKLEKVAKRCDFLTLSGSLAPGLPTDFYKTCIERVRAVAPDCRVVVDAEGAPLIAALEAAPYLIKPNINEFEKTFACKVENVAALDRKAKEILKKYGLSMLCVSLGGEGAYLTDGERAVFGKPAPVEVKSLTGAGDAMVAGLCIALSKNLPLDEVLRYGIATSGATVQVEGTQPGSRADFEALLAAHLDIKEL